MNATAEKTYKVIVDYTKSLVEMVKAGKYDWVDDDITEEYFRSSADFWMMRIGTKEVELHLIHLNRLTSSDDVIRELNKLGLRPATIKELLSFGSTYKDEQRKYPIVALGSVGGLINQHVPYLFEDESDSRDLGSRWSDLSWDVNYRFLAVSK